MGCDGFRCGDVRWVVVNPLACLHCVMCALCTCTVLERISGMYKRDNENETRKGGVLVVHCNWGAREEKRKRPNVMDDVTSIEPGKPGQRGLALQGCAVGKKVE